MKTLKDFEEHILGYQREIAFKETYLFEELKAEAVKCLSYGIEDMKRPEQIADKIIKNFIDFFGWTEEDLK